MEIPQSYNGKPLTASWKYCAMDGAPLGVVARYQNGTDKKDIVPNVIKLSAKQLNMI